LVCANVRSKFLEKRRSARAVAWWTIRLALGLENGLAHGGRVEQLERYRLGPELAYTLGLGGRSGGADHLVPSIDQLGDEAGADRTARPDDEDSHRVLPSGLGLQVLGGKFH
jgi:hypothetical protein